jgi:hypothetical protein
MPARLCLPSSGSLALAHSRHGCQLLPKNHGKTRPLAGAALTAIHSDLAPTLRTAIEAMTAAALAYLSTNRGART